MHGRWVEGEEICLTVPLWATAGGWGEGGAGGTCLRLLVHQGGRGRRARRALAVGGHDHPWAEHGKTRRHALVADHGRPPTCMAPTRMAPTLAWCQRQRCPRRSSSDGEQRPARSGPKAGRVGLVQAVTFHTIESQNTKILTFLTIESIKKTKNQRTRLCQSSHTASKL